ncbi:MAG TPA: hypothetical protein VJB57_18780 [Dehalococcoidia bacterium]|nr:hypothetical protein [Dehalococcoidia bacterium]
MRLRLTSAIALGALLWLVSLSPGVQPTKAAFAEGPSAIADPVSGPLSQPFVFYLTGFQPYTQLTLSFLPPGAGAYIVVGTPQPLVTDGFGQAVAPLSVPDLLAADPSAGPLAAFLGFVNVVWAPVSGGIAYFYVAACDTVNCAETVGTVVPN